MAREVTDPRGAVETTMTTTTMIADALAHESSLSLAESIRTFASQSRAKGDSIHDVLGLLMRLAQQSTPRDATVAKRSSDVAEWAIAGYFEERVSMRTALWHARGARRGRRTERVKSEEAWARGQ
jgi:hypothetical protein